MKACALTWHWYLRGEALTVGIDLLILLLHVIVAILVSGTVISIIPPAYHQRALGRISRPNPS